MKINTHMVGMLVFAQVTWLIIVVLHMLLYIGVQMLI